MSLKSLNIFGVCFYGGLENLVQNISVSIVVQKFPFSKYSWTSIAWTSRGPMKTVWARWVFELLSFNCVQTLSIEKNSGWDITNVPALAVWAIEVPL